MQTLESRASEIRARLSAIGGMTDLDDETRGELDKLKKEYTDNDAKQAALKIAGDAPATPLETTTGEGREFRSLVNGGNVGEIFDAAINNGTVDGATAELQAHYGLKANQVPLALMVRHPGTLSHSITGLGMRATADLRDAVCVRLGTSPLPRTMHREKR